MEKSLENINKMRDMFKDKTKILVLSGAGLSKEAGIPDFRSKDGLYSKNFYNLDPEYILSHDFLMKNPELFYEYIRENMNYKEVFPTDVYNKIANLEKEGRVLGVITQNIDGLHKKSGSKNVVEAHGNLIDFYCTKCNKKYDMNEMLEDREIFCTCGGLIRPDVVLYGEELKDMKKIQELIYDADSLLVLGSSLLVYPIAYIPNMFLAKGKPVGIINLDKVSIGKNENLIEINEKISDVFFKILDNSL